ncbi:hypothetical protein [Streptomyces rubellomurinus]|uniref:DUF1963 domain-containing protein n=1 Tax=Streptomyces rubellomurinus (strain ATCC 31215) TaxID=359131 RepID=A0A0F2TBH5_STRR3|nr:hypothetical protein [Streptomyces rubellomurinus]KJS60504.1 hypothetical protein VM95_20835 [Streptomyces rubellomurinus]
MSRTTPSRRVDIAAVFPELAPLARRTVRLHPRLGAPGVRDSSVGGPLLWPADEPWPVCEGPHPEEGDDELPVSPACVRLRRGLYARMSAGHQLDDQERAALDATYEGHAWGREPNALLPVAQLYARDIPGLPCPDGADLLQVLWCPLEHEPEELPAARLVWRSAAEVGAVLPVPPEPAHLSNHGDYVPEPCVLHPEVVTEYPAPGELEPGLAERIEDWCVRELTGADPRYQQEYQFRAYYSFELSVAPGWKAGGWGPWGFRDPWVMRCGACESVMSPLLTISSGQLDGSGWDPVEDRDAEEDLGVKIGRSYSMQLYHCPQSFEHPHLEVMQ